MTEKQNRVRQTELDLRIAQSKLLDARCNFEHGTAKAKADYEKEYERLKQEMERATIDVERERAWLETARAALETPFETNDSST